VHACFNCTLAFCLPSVTPSHANKKKGKKKKKKVADVSLPSIPQGHSIRNLFDSFHQELQNRNHETGKSTKSMIVFKTSPFGESIRLVGLADRIAINAFRITCSLIHQNRKVHGDHKRFRKQTCAKS
jgi:hypothetical protein